MTRSLLRLLVLLALLAPCGVARALAPQGPLEGPYRVLRVVDGDTLDVLRHGVDERVRLIGIDSPETHDPDKPVQPFGPEASLFATRLLGGRQVWLELDERKRDDYDRLLAYVYFEDPDGSWSWQGHRLAQANLVIALEGFARLMTIPPDVRYAELYGYAVRVAREGGRGMWAEPTVAPPGPGAAAPPAAPGGAVRVRCVLFDPAGPDDGKEAVTLDVTADVDTSGWTIRDDARAPHAFALPRRAFHAGDTITVPNPGDPVWNNGGDTVHLLDAAGAEVDRLRYEGDGSRACR